jgi:cysteine desulfurase
MKQFIYADNAATTKLDMAAFEAMMPYLIEEYGNPSQPYFFGRKAQRAVCEARKTVAACINASPEEIFFTSGGTESDNWAIKCFGYTASDILNIYTSSIEHHAVLNACKYMSDAFRATVRYLPVSKDGKVAPDVLEKDMLAKVDMPVVSCERTLVSIMFANNEIGTIQPIKELAAIAHKHGAYFHTDAVQAVGHVPIDVQELGVDMLSASAHKFNGPKGIGFLYIRKNTPLHSLHSGGAQEFGKRAGTENVAAIVGMAKALEDNSNSILRNQAYLMNLENVFLERLNLSGVNYIRNGSENHVPGNISLSFLDADGEMLLHRLDLKGIMISTGSACDSQNTQISHVIKATGTPKEYAKGTVRISLGKHNTAEEARYIADMLASTIMSRSN